RPVAGLHLSPVRRVRADLQRDAAGGYQATRQAAAGLGRMRVATMRKILVVACLLPLAAVAGEPAIGLAQGLLAGEPTEHSIILQARLTGERRDDGGIEGAAGVARFELSRDAGFDEYRATEWREAEAEQDFIVKLRVESLEPAARYHYRLRYGRDRENRSEERRVGQECRARRWPE